MTICHNLFPYRTFSLFACLTSLLVFTHAQSFQDVTPVPIMPLEYDVRNGSIAAGDYNNDGSMDLYISGINAFGHHVAFICQNNSGLFIPDSLASSQLIPLAYGSAQWGDYDNDGFLDLVACGEDSLGNLHTQVYHNNGTGELQQIQQNPYPPLGLRHGEVQWGDYNNDGRLDVLVNGEAKVPNNGQLAYINYSEILNNNQNGQFSQNLGHLFPNFQQGSNLLVDVDMDTHLEIIECGNSSTGGIQFSFTRNSSANYPYVNSGLNTSDSIYPAVSNSSWAYSDFNQDGLIDLIVSGMRPSGNHISSIYQLLSTDASGFPVFSEIPVPLPQVAGGSALWGDYTNDGIVDLFVSGKGNAGFSQAGVAIGTGNSSTPFLEDSLSSQVLQGTDSGQVVWIDFSNDGRLDLISIGDIPAGVGPNFRMYQNIHSSAPMMHNPPTNLSNSIDSIGQIILSWDAPLSPGTKSYNVCVGSSKDSADIFHPMADLITGQRSILRHGNAGINESLMLRGLDEGMYYWSVQTIGADYQGSVFAPIDSFYYSTSSKVYPGDTNHDQIVNMWDILPIGIKYNFTGPPRPIFNVDWTGQSAQEWADSLANGVNTKHVDALGDGVIDSIDLIIVNNHYGLTHTGSKFSSSSGAPLFLTGMPSSINPGDSVSLDLHLGTSDTMAIDFYGLAFSINYDSSLIEPGSVEVQFDSSWLGAPDISLLTLARDQHAESKVDIGLVRKDQTNKTGYGKIASIIIVMDDDISKRDIPFELTFGDIQAIDASENQLDVNGQPASSFVDTEPNSIDPELLNGLTVFPNPISLHRHHFLEITSEGIDMTGITLFDLNGLQLTGLTNPLPSHRFRLPIQDLNPGIYLLRVQSKAGMATRKICLLP